MKIYEFQLNTRHSELDSSLHINNANFLRYLEEARVGMMKDQDFLVEEVHDANVQVILYKYVCHFKQQVRYPQHLLIRSKQIQTKKVRGILRQEIYLENGSLCFEADAYWAYHAKEKSQIKKTHEFAQKYGQWEHAGVLPLKTEKENEMHDSFAHNVSPIEVRPYELDSFQHVNNAVYANYFEVGRWNFRRDVLKNTNSFKNLDLIFVLYKTTLNFIKPAFLFEELYVKTWLVELTPLRIIYWQELQDKNGVLRASCRSEGCAVNKKGVPTKLPPDILLAYKKMLCKMPAQ